MATGKNVRDNEVGYGKLIHDEMWLFYVEMHIHL